MNIKARYPLSLSEFALLAGLALRATFRSKWSAL